MRSVKDFIKGLHDSDFTSEKVILNMLENRGIRFKTGRNKAMVIDDNTKEYWTIDFVKMPFEYITIRKGNLSISRQIAEASKLTDDSLINLLIATTKRPWDFEISHEVARKELKDRLK